MDKFLADKVLEPEELPEPVLIGLQIEKLNRNSNNFLLMLLKKHTQIYKNTNFIAHDLLPLLFNPLLINPFNRNLEKFIPINKTFVYAILNLPISK